MNAFIKITLLFLTLVYLYLYFLALSSCGIRPPGENIFLGDENNFIVVSNKTVTCDGFNGDEHKRCLKRYGKYTYSASYFCNSNSCSGKTMNFTSNKEYFIGERIRITLTGEQ